MADIARNAQIRQHVHELEGALWMLGEEIVRSGLSRTSSWKPFVSFKLDGMDEIRNCESPLVYVDIDRAIVGAPSTETVVRREGRLTVCAIVDEKRWYVVANQILVAAV